MTTPLDYFMGDLEEATTHFNERPNMDRARALAAAADKVLEAHARAEAAREEPLVEASDLR